MKRTLTSETWQKIGQPDLGSVIFFKDKTGNKVFGKIDYIDFGNKKGIRIGINPFNKK